MNLKFETIVQFFKEIIQLNAVIILKGTNEYYRKIILKSGFKMDLYPAMCPHPTRRKKPIQDDLLLIETESKIFN